MGYEGPPFGWTLPPGFSFAALVPCPLCGAKVARCDTAKGNRVQLDPDGRQHAMTCPGARVVRAAPEPAPLSGDAGGETYVAERPDEPDSDRGRLDRQRAAVWEAMHDGGWHTLADVARRTGHPEASVSARLRDFRKAAFGGHTVERRYVGAGLHHYRLVPREGTRP